MPLTREQWAEVEKRCTQFFSNVSLLCDGYKVSLELERDGKFKNVIMVYIDGKFLGVWMTQDCEQRRRFFNPRKVGVGKFGKDLLKFHKKYNPAKYREIVANPIFVYSPCWTNFNALKRHFIKHNTSIELVSETA
jgi:hypothetical protein